MTRPIAIDLFAGVGGMSLGFEQAGFDVVAAVEIDPIHAAAHAFNFPRCAILPQTVVGLTGRNIRDAAGLTDQPINVVFGGPPCQGFSMIGHRALDDERNVLVREFVRIVGELEPDYFVFENVKGLTIGKHRKFLDELIEEFATMGYRARIPWRVLDAADFGVPQHRERLVLIGAKKRIRLPDYPAPSHRAIGCERHNLLPSGPSCSDAIGDLPDADQFPALLETDAVSPGEWGNLSSYAQELRCLTNDAWHFGYPREWNPTCLTASARTNHTEISRRRFAAALPGTAEPISRFFKLDKDGLSNTLRAGTDGARGAFTSPRPIHYAFPRCITVREMARLHGFPDWFRFHSTKWHGARQIGNAVPPPLARAVGASILRAMGHDPVSPHQKIELGDVVGLYMDLTSAAAHFGIVPPRSRRDRKSGARKRKQQEIEAELKSAEGTSRGAEH